MWCGCSSRRSIIGATKALEMIQNGVVLPSVAKRQKKVPIPAFFSNLFPEDTKRERTDIILAAHCISRVQKSCYFFVLQSAYYNKLQVEVLYIQEAFCTATNLFGQCKSESRLVDFAALDRALGRRKSRTRSCSSEWRRRR